jgi:hypothetical protein
LGASSSAAWGGRPKRPQASRNIRRRSPQPTRSGAPGTPPKFGQVTKVCRFPPETRAIIGGRSSRKKATEARQLFPAEFPRNGDRSSPELRTPVRRGRGGSPAREGAATQRGRRPRGAEDPAPANPDATRSPASHEARGLGGTGNAVGEPERISKFREYAVLELRFPRGVAVVPRGWLRNRTRDLC